MMIEALIIFLIASIMGVSIYDKSTIETIYYNYGISPSEPSSFDYIMYYGTRISVVLCIFFICLLIYKSKKKEWEIEKNTVEISKIIYKGIVIAKDSKSDTYGHSNDIRTVHRYTTSVRIPDINDTVYFYDKYTYLNCMENEAVGILVTSNLDKNGQILAIKYDFMNSYNQYQDIKDQYMRNLGMGDAVVGIKNVPWNDYIIF